jgi:hypothetical protein
MDRSLTPTTRLPCPADSEPNHLPAATQSSLADLALATIAEEKCNFMKICVKNKKKSQFVMNFR